MNRVDKTIGWATWTANSISGCRNQETGHCSGFPCYARGVYERFKKSFEPTFHPERLDEPAKVKKPSRIFIGSVTDFGSEGVEESWIRAVVEATRKAKQHKYMLLTKRPDRLPEWLADEDWYFGTSVTTQADVGRISDLIDWAKGRTNRLFISAEPLLSPVDIKPWAVYLRWAIVGALTRGGTVKPENGGTDPAWANDLAWAANAAGVPVYMKSNLAPLYEPGAVLRQEWPEGLKLKETP